MNNSHIDVSLSKIRTIFEKASARIDALKVGEKITATGLAKDLAEEIGMTGPQLYPTLKFLFDRYPGVKVSRGAHGGIEKLPETNATTSTVDGTVVVNPEKDSE
jgi:hypothetical protein